MSKLGVATPSGALPTYEQSISKPSSSATARFGRWQSWVEKRAHERHQDREELPRDGARADTRPPSYTANYQIGITTSIPSTGLNRIDLGSQFIPHSSDRIVSFLSISDIVIVGTVHGLKVIKLSNEENPSRHVWTGLPVWEMRILDSSSTEGGTPKGIVAILCGGKEDAKTGRPAGRKGSDLEIRIWRLESLFSLVRWSSMQPTDYRGLEVSNNGETSSSSIPYTWYDDFARLNLNTSASIITTAISVEHKLLVVATAANIRLYELQSNDLRHIKNFYIPHSPTLISMLRLATPPEEDFDEYASAFGLNPSERRPDLGLFVGMGNKGCMINIKNSAVMSLPNSSLAPWQPVMETKWRDQDVYVMTHGVESIIYKTPLDFTRPVEIDRISWTREATSITSMHHSSGSTFVASASTEIQVAEVGPELDTILSNGTLKKELRILGEAEQRGKCRAIACEKVKDRDFRLVLLEAE